MFNFGSAYSRKDAKDFLLREFLPEDFQPSEKERAVENSDKKVIKKVYELGRCESLDLTVFEMVHESINDPRVTVTKEAFDILRRETFSSVALVFFVSRLNPEKYRFSLIYFDYCDKGKRVEVRRSNPRRLSFLLGEGIPCHTAEEYLSKKGRVSSFDDLKKRFSVEVLTESFYKELSDWYAWALLSDEVKFPNSISGNEKVDNANKAQDLIRLLTRLLFVWFMKQKKLIPDFLFDEDYLRDNVLKDFEPNYTEGSLFGYKPMDSIYYRAILQNLFFATLNCPITKEGTTNQLQRGFRTEGQHYGISYLMRYKKMFINPDKFVEKMNETVPFLNGALFDCLDQRFENPPVFIDGFSESMNSSDLCVPDYFFFGEKQEDISSYYGERGRRQTNVYGLIDILKKYNFTVEENTPIDMEVSLDPELLGKVFENLLASYNPETQTTARKQTGSFYTPRVIVQFMVDESLVAYLKTKTPATEEQIRDLLSFENNSEPLEEELNKSVIDAIYNCKILDPACGSGAFPMGMLQQLVHVLRQLDPDNNYWKELVLKSAENDSNRTYKSTMSVDEKAERIKDINSSFDESLNNPDYSRKLYLIENCIYGVDIQPIAAQISKLRFFISLVVEQKPSNDKFNNFGIKPLPNLDSKIVAANTLLKLKKRQATLFTNPEILNLQNEQKDACHRLFYAKTAPTKKKYEEIIKDLRIKASNLLKEDDALGNEDAEMLGSWDMFNQNSSASFFDPEWMFGLDSLFDIVIGNPPYIRLQENGGELANLYSGCGYSSFDRGGDIYCLFYERGIGLLNESGVLAFITSNSWMRSGYGKKLREFLSEFNPSLLINFSGTKIFKSVTVDTNILFVQKNQNLRHTVACKAYKMSDEMMSSLSRYFKNNSKECCFCSSDPWIILSEIELSIKRKIERIGDPLGNWDVQINYGIKNGRKEAYIIDENKRQEILSSCTTEQEKERTDGIIRPILFGKDIKKSGYNWRGLYIINFHNGLPQKNIPALRIEDYPSLRKHFDNYYSRLVARADQGDSPYNLRNCTYWNDFYKQKLIYPETTYEASFVIDNDGMFVDKTCFVMFSKDIVYLQATLSSELFEFAYKNLFSSVELGEKGYQYNKTTLQTLPIKKEYDKGKIYTNDDIYELYGINEAEKEHIRNALNSDRKVSD